ncbi:sigma-70 family RNA polymerase sigma factor [Fibrella sp. HMF5335]|uniref:Sigma-70 family RNA polymerase sigma factor n=1 Tax=Fibrella rubiginis TaxID=2817060 RepID=A0A939K5E0_9BACT|nr:sigma-70 family RNA polymerase sigma factor [Fibrella rubiginis]MBO0939384.1 sigma-70 family RNA polymerase sigma factor [Fibrella rubiginis]
MALTIPHYLTESRLVAALQQQEARAQRVVYERYGSRMLAVCMRYVGNHDDAEEVLIDGFMRVYNRIGQFRGDGSFEGWMRRVMVTESLMYLRKNKAWRQEQPLDTITVEPDYEWADANLQSEDLIRLVAQLPDGYRTVFNLYAIEGYNHAEIAELTGISEGTSKSQLSRARALLQQKVRNMETGYKTASHYGKAANR